ncbi:ejaculatory bulb-specific protein 3-like [Maniola hyperantus]|uniref:ejaculatory bulb-specific protein 3-like n=1 Tax=Aphantopus hyperantus TaxID=2795564 RepID=UPI001567C7EF|nr:ejaculatory bulb-specific protein 3-like [Maniola hyperantus]
MVSKSCLIISCLLVAVLANDKYTSKYDNLEVKPILKNKRLLNAYTDCMLDIKAKCTPEGNTLRDHLGDALETGCEKCTEIQKTKATEVIEHLIKFEREIWNKLTAKYDPEGVWRKKYEDLAREKGIVIPKD